MFHDILFQNRGDGGGRRRIDFCLCFPDRYRKIQASGALGNCFASEVGRDATDRPIIDFCRNPTGG